MIELACVPSWAYKSVEALSVNKKCDSVVPKKGRTASAVGIRTASHGEGQPAHTKESSVAFDASTGTFIRVCANKRPLEQAATNPNQDRIAALRRRVQEKRTAKEECDRAAPS